MKAPSAPNYGIYQQRKTRERQEYLLRTMEETRKRNEVIAAHAAAKDTQAKQQGPRCKLCPVVDRFPTRCGTCEGT